MPVLRTKCKDFSGTTMFSAFQHPGDDWSAASSQPFRDRRGKKLQTQITTTVQHPPHQAKRGDPRLTPSQRLSNRKPVLGDNLLDICIRREGVWGSERVNGRKIETSGYVYLPGSHMQDIVRIIACTIVYYTRTKL